MRLKDQMFRLLRPFVRFYTDQRRMNSIAVLCKKLLPSFKLSEGSIVLDLGANRGDFTLFASKQGALVLAFEPNQSAFKYIVSRLSEYKNIIFLNAAISNSFGLMDFYFHSDNKSDPLGYSIRSSLVKKESTYFKAEQKVLSLGIAELLKALPKVNCLKVDIEGAELDIWPTVMQNFEKIEFLLMEIHDLVNPKLRDEFNNFVREHNLQARWTAEWQ